jgi:S1/P1 Nuclease
MTTLRTYLCAVLFALLPVSLMAWGPIGHMAVAAAAYQQLTPATKARIRDLLKLNPEYANWESKIPAGTSAEDHDRIIFMIAATWADDIKGDSKYSDDGPDPNTPDGATSSLNIGYTDLFRHRYWHFVDMPFSPDHTTLPAIPTPNAQTQIVAFRAVLSSTQPDALKSYDLVWLLHLIGDVHQPLHATTRVTAGDPTGDAGGNKVSGDASSNLHSYWDDLPGFDCSFCSSRVHCAERAEVLTKSLKTPTIKAAHSTDTAVWIEESFAAAKVDVYRAPVASGDGPYTIVPMSLYETAAYRLAQKRIALAGLRLADVLNHELK